MKHLTLANLKPGDKAKIVSFNNLEQYARQLLMTLGLLPGSLFTLECRAPLGDPVKLNVNGTLLSLRLAEVGHLSVEKVTT